MKLFLGDVQQVMLVVVRLPSWVTRMHPLVERSCSWGHGSHIAAVASILAW